MEEIYRNISVDMFISVDRVLEREEGVVPVQNDMIRTRSQKTNKRHGTAPPSPVLLCGML